ncbi:MAG: hypothetical protein E6Q56_08085 [Mycobacterium sp.]|nr:MAG: hypothetical protein E6Q56_08085 [Mycobacterium sp.]
MRKKSKSAEDFINGLAEHIEQDVLRQKKTIGKRENEIQAGLRHIICGYVEGYYQGVDYKKYKKKAAAVVYWEGQDGSNVEKKTSVFAARSYPDFIIREPYRIAIEYKQSATGALVKQGIGQGLMYVLSGDYDFAYLLFDDQSKDKVIRESMANPREQAIVQRLWRDFNTKIQIL